MNAAMREVFIAEARPRLTELLAGCAAMQTGQQPSADERAAWAASLQTLKATAGLAGSAEIARLCLALRDVAQQEHGLKSPEGVVAYAAGVAALAQYCDHPDTASQQIDAACAELLRISSLPQTPEGVRAAPQMTAQISPSIASQPQSQDTAGVGAARVYPARVEIDAVLLEMFRQEAEERLAALSEHILGLEADPRDAAHLEALMRAAHSLKGAARIIGLSPVEQLGHALEDYFVAAQKGELVITPEAADHLLAAVDGLGRLAQRTEDDPQPYLAILRSLGGGAVIPASDSMPLQAAVAPSEELPPEQNISETASPAFATAAVAASPDPVRESGGREETVRLAAASLTRIMSLAGETVVQAQELAPFVSSLRQVKRRSLRQLDLLQAYITRTVAAGQPDPLLEELRHDINVGIVDLQQRLASFEQVSRRAGDLAGRLYRETLSSRMRPFREGVRGFDRLVRDLSRQLGKKVAFRILGEDTRVDRDVLTRLEAPLTHLLRNAIDHGMQTPEERHAAGKQVENQLVLEALHWAGFLNIRISDDGRGIDLARVREKIVEKGLHDQAAAAALSEEETLEFLFLPGFSTAGQVTEISGRGVGLDVVREMLHTLGGGVRIENRPGHGCAFRLRLPVTRSVARMLLVEVGMEVYALPLSRIDRLLKIAPEAVCKLEGRPYLCDGGDNIGLADAQELLGIGECVRGDGGRLPVVVVRGGDRLLGLRVDSFLGERELVIKPLDSRLGKIRHVSAVVTLDDGRIALLLDIDDLLSSSAGAAAPEQTAALRTTGRVASRASRILVVDDSPTVREMERRLLCADGYEVETAGDGMEGWLQLRGRRFDLVISDVDMPRMNGIEMVRTLRSNPDLERMPVLLVSYKDRPGDREAGLAAGADGYFTKGGFEGSTFLRAVRDFCEHGRKAGQSAATAAAAGLDANANEGHS